MLIRFSRVFFVFTNLVCIQQAVYLLSYFPRLFQDSFKITVFVPLGEKNLKCLDILRYSAKHSLIVLLVFQQTYRTTYIWSKDSRIFNIILGNFQLIGIFTIGFSWLIYTMQKNIPHFSAIKSESIDYYTQKNFITQRNTEDISGQKKHKTYWVKCLASCYCSHRNSKLYWVNWWLLLLFNGVHPSERDVDHKQLKRDQ